MSRRRYLSTKISQDAKINRLATKHGDFAALLYTWMIPHAEDDGTLSGDPEELLMTVMPGRRDKDVEDIETALQAMHDLGLIVWTRGGERSCVAFPESFYQYQTYITEKRRGTAQAGNKAASSAHDSAPENESAQNAANQRTTAQNATSFKSSFKSKFPLGEEDVPTERGASAPPADASSEPEKPGTNGHKLTLPPRRDSDTTERAYWERILKEAPANQRTALLVRLAHEKIGADDMPGCASYARLGKMAKDYHGAGLVATWILQAATEHIAGDPLDYLAKVAKRQTSRASQNGHTRTAANNTPNYTRTAEQAAPKGWENC